MPSTIASKPGISDEAQQGRQPIGSSSRWWFWGALAMAFLRVLPALRFPIGRDEATYCVIAERLLHGQALYRDAWDNKPPGIFYIYTIIVKLFGHATWSVGAVDILWLLAISACIWFFARRYLGAPAAAVAVVFNAHWHCSLGYTHAAQPETFLMLFLFLGYFLLSSEHLPNLPRNLAAGLLFGAAFWLKYNAAPLIAVLAILPYLDFSTFDQQPRRVRLAISWRTWLARTLLVAAGFLAVSASVLLYFWTSGAMPALREVQFEVLPRYGSMFLEHSRNYLYYSTTLIRMHLGPFTEAAFGVALLVAWWRRELRLISPVAIMAVTGFISTTSQVRFSSYSFETTYPFLAMLWGYLICKGYEGFVYLRRELKTRGWKLAAVLLWIAAAQVLYFPLPDVAFTVVEDYKGLAEWISNPRESYVNYPFPYRLETLGDQFTLIDYVRNNSAQQDGVFIWGTAPLINFLSGRPNPSRFVSNFPLISRWGPAKWRNELIGELNRKPPRFIIVERHDSIPEVTLTYDDSEQCLEKFPALLLLIRSRYAPVKDLKDFEIYGRTSP